MCNMWYTVCMKRIVVYVEQVQYSNLKAKCAINGTSVSEWFRNAADDFLSEFSKNSLGSIVPKVSTKAKEILTLEKLEEIEKNVSTQKISKKIIPEKTEDKTSPGAPQVATPFVEEGQECSWDKTFNCTSPGVIQIRGKWYCIVHAKEI